ncbi:uncharacterized protein LOC115330343 [Ixodes scapularis]|uniref:uncharacterized protein LOC115330343 n=1 Tax=Ixodes scapularis TaxID=6945 RepID=UPI001A9D85F5|nr:uncharacterized protein LOC115330343 [Ixodes scapularis]
MEVDTGAAVSVLPLDLYKTRFPNLVKGRSGVVLRAFTGKKVKPVGEAQVEVEYQDQVHKLPLQIVDFKGPPLLGRDWLEVLRNPRPNDRDPYNDSSEAPEVGLSASRTPLHHRPPVFRGKCQCRLLVKTPKSNGQPQHRRRRRNVRLLLNTRHPTTRESPAQLMLQRHLRTRLDLLKPSVADCVASAHYRQQRQHPGQERAFTAGDQVYARDYRSGHKWQPGTVAAQTGPVSFQVQVSPGRVWRRHQDQLLRAPSQDSGPSESRPDEAGGVSATAWTDSTPEDSAGDRCLSQASLPAPSEVPRPRSNTQDAETLVDADNSDGERRYPVRDRRKPRRLIEE